VVDANEIDVTVVSGEAGAILQIPEAMKILRELHEQPSVEDTDSRADQQLEQLRTGLISYAGLHLELRDWKKVHEGLHMLILSASSLVWDRDDESRKSPGSASDLRKLWGLVDLTVVRVYFGEQCRYEHIPDLWPRNLRDSSDGEFDWRRDVAARIKRLDKTFSESNPQPISIRAKAQDLQMRANQLLSYANEKLLDKSEQLVAVSDDLVGRL
jgi:hypothetical protein